MRSLESIIKVNKGNVEREHGRPRSWLDINIRVTDDGFASNVPTGCRQWTIWCRDTPIGDFVEVGPNYEAWCEGDSLGFFATREAAKEAVLNAFVWRS